MSIATGRSDMICHHASSQDYRGFIPAGGGMIRVNFNTNLIRAASIDVMRYSEICSPALREGSRTIAPAIYSNGVFTLLCGSCITRAAIREPRPNSPACHVYRSDKRLNILVSCKAELEIIGEST